MTFGSGDFGVPDPFLSAGRSGTTLGKAPLAPLALVRALPRGGVRKCLGGDGGVPEGVLGGRVDPDGPGVGSRSWKAADEALGVQGVSGGEDGGSPL